MAKDDINIALGRLEQSLKNLDTARQDVEKVVTSNRDFSEAANNLVMNANTLVSQIQSVTEHVIEQFSEKLNDSKESMDSIVKDSADSIKNNITALKTADQKLVKTVESAIKDIATLSKNNLEEQKKESGILLSDLSAHIKNLQDNLTNTLNQFKKYAEQCILSLQGNATKAIEEQKMENLKTLNQILETHNQIKQVTGQLLDLPNALKELNENLEKQRQQNIKQFQSMKKMQIITFVGIGIFNILLLIF